MLTVIFLAIIPNDVLLDYMFVYVSWCVAVFACALDGGGDLALLCLDCPLQHRAWVYVFISLFPLCVCSHKAAVSVNVF